MSAVAAVVPAFDEAANIGDLVRELRSLPEPVEVFVIDDGSSDATAAQAAAAGATVIRLAWNCGIGAAVQTGLRAALEQAPDAIARLDGDGQHAPADLPALLERLRQGSSDFVLGSRRLDARGFETTWSRRAGSRWFSLLLRALHGVAVTDPTSGFWVANRAAAEALRDCYASDYPEVDSLVELKRRGLRIEEATVAMRPRGAGRSSIGGFYPLYYMIKVSVALLVSRLRPPRYPAA